MFDIRLWNQDSLITGQAPLFADIKEKEEFTDEIKEKMNKALTSFGDTFKATKGLN